jgi:hypothetical protein
MQRLLLFIGILDIFEQFEPDLNTLGFESVRGRLLKLSCHIVSIHGFQLNSMLLLHEVYVFEFLGHHEKKRGARGGDTGSSSHSVHIVLDRARQIVLDDPLNLFKIKTTRGNISTNKN